MTPRSYQQRAIERLRELRRAGNRRMLLVAPTGSGKTAIACMVIAGALSHDQRILVLGHRKEICDQFWGALNAQGITAGVMRADDERRFDLSPVQIGTVQTLVRRELPPADLVFVDEAHRIPGDSYQRILDAYPKATIIGLTATPCRLDGVGLRNYFDALLEVEKYSELTFLGWLSAPIVYAPKFDVDLSGVRKMHGDYEERALERVMTQPHVVGDVLREWKEKACGRSTVIFAVGIEHSKAIAAQFAAEGIACAHLDGTTPEDERIQILCDLEVGRLQVVSNVGVLCEGWDQPRVKCCVMARPTLSLTLYMQCVGRILRPWEKVVPIVLDHAGNTARHGLPHMDREWSLDGAPKQDKKTTHTVCNQCFAYVERFPCPLCDYSPPVVSREVRVADGVLERIDAAIERDRAAEKTDPRRAYFDKMADQARERGFKPGFASAKYKEKYGEWPPWAWSQSVRDQFAQDEQWQEDLARTEARRAFWQARKAAAPPIESGPVELPAEEPETFQWEDL
jgi:DNA repair protein RadD